MIVIVVVLLTIDGDIFDFEKLLVRMQIRKKT